MSTVRDSKNLCKRKENFLILDLKTGNFFIFYKVVVSVHDNGYMILNILHFYHFFFNSVVGRTRSQ